MDISNVNLTLYIHNDMMLLQSTIIVGYNDIR